MKPPKHWKPQMLSAEDKKKWTTPTPKVKRQRY